MGFWGSLVLCRPAGALGDVDAIVSRDESVTEVSEPGGAWRIGQGEDTALIEDAEDFLRDLVQESGAPALLGFVMDSDCVDLVALGTASGLWRSCLDRAARQAYADDGALEESILLPDAATERAAAWAAEAGLEPDMAAVRRVFSRAGEDLFAESLFFELVDALGVAKAARAVLPPKPKARHNRKQSSNPLDAFVYDYATDVLRSEGFHKRGRVFTRSNDRGDSAVVQFSSHALGNLVDFELFGGVVAGPVADFAAGLFGGRGTPPDGRDVTWQISWLAPRQPDTPWQVGVWSARDTFERERLGGVLGQTLSEDVVPELAALLDRPTLIELVQNPRLFRDSPLMGANGLAVVVLADEGPSVALHLAIRALRDHSFDHAALDWARRRTAEQGFQDDSWREGIWQSAADPYVRLAAMLEAAVDAPMAAAGFVRTGTSYRLESELGDSALIEFTPLVASRGSVLRFRISSAVLPGPEMEWRRARAAAHPDFAPGVLEPETRSGWLQRWYPPPSAHAATNDPRTSLDIGRWRFTSDTMADCGAAIVELLSRDVVPQLRSLLDRAQLLTTVLSSNTQTAAFVHHAHATIILLVDAGPSDQLETALQYEEAGRGPTEPELAAWARARLQQSGTA